MLDDIGGQKFPKNKRRAADIHDALRAAGYAIVPVEPTEAMVKRIVPDEEGDKEHQKAIRVCRVMVMQDWKAMLAAVED